MTSLFVLFYFACCVSFCLFVCLIVWLVGWLVGRFCKHGKQSCTALCFRGHLHIQKKHPLACAEPWICRRGSSCLWRLSGCECCLELSLWDSLGRLDAIARPLLHVMSVYVEPLDCRIGWLSPCAGVMSQTCCFWCMSVSFKVNPPRVLGDQASQFIAQTPEGSAKNLWAKIISI